MAAVYGTFLDLPPEQQAIRAKCLHPSGSFEEFGKEEIEQSIPERFEKIVRRYPDRIAVKTANQTLTYDQLNATANRLARAIVAQQGNALEPIALLLDKDTPLIAAMIGALKAGKIFVPLDPSVPRARTAEMLQNSQAKWVITNRRNAPLAGEIASAGCGIVEYEAAAADESADDLFQPVPPGSPACILYTSGSTGRPKGVVWSHRNWLHKIRLSTNIFLVCDQDRITLLGSAASPNALTTIFLALLNGAALAPFGFHKEGVGRLAHWLAEEGITFCLISAPLFRALCEAITPAHSLSHLRLIRVASEAVYKTDVDLYKRFFPPSCIFATGLSIAETGYVRVCYVDHHSEVHGNQAPVGYAVEDKEILLLDEAGNEVGGGETGEIVVKSGHLSSGYWRDPELTQEKFKPDPGGGPAVLYFTGDLGSMRSDGCLVHKGRKDFRVKIRGFGVELIEVERALRDHTAIAEAVVVVQQGPSAEARLVAYFVPGRSRPGIGELQKFLRDKLPDYMIPSVFVILDEIPLTPNGKIDRRALPPPGRARPELESPFVAPRTPVEESLAKIWAETLGLDQVGIHDSFLDLGGHSLMATQIILRVVQSFRVELRLQSLLEASTIEKMALIITQNQARKASEEDVARLLAELEALSEDEAQRLLSEKGARQP